MPTNKNHASKYADRDGVVDDQRNQREPSELLICQSGTFYVAAVEKN